MKKVIFSLLILFIFTLNVNAIECNDIEITSSNACGIAPNINNECGFEVKTRGTLQNGRYEKEVPGIDPNVKDNYRFLVFLDDSNSMNGTNLTTAKDSLKEIVDKLNEYGYGNSEMSLIKFTKGKVFENRKISAKDKIKNKIDNDLGEFKSDTNFNKPLNTALAMVEDMAEDQKRPFIIFITDGYPTTNAPKGNMELGYLSSAGLFYEATIRFQKLMKKVKEMNGEIVTGGIGIGSTKDTMANFLLNPSDETFDNLKNDGNDESKRYFSLINDYGKAKEEVIFVAGIGSYPDYGLVGYTKIEDTNKGTNVYFNNLNVLNNNSKSGIKEKVKKRGIYIGPITNNSPNESWFNLCRGNNYGTCIKADSIVNKEGLKYVVFKDDDAVKFVGSSVKSWKLKSSKHKITRKTVDFNDKVDVNFLRNKDNGVRAFFSNVDEASDIDWTKVINSLNKKISEESVSSSCVKQEYVVPSGETVYNGFCSNRSISFEGKYKYKTKDVSRIFVDIIRTEDIVFKPGTLSNSKDYFVAGRGFDFKDIILNGKSTWYYKEFSKGIPIIKVKFSGTNEIRKVPINDVLNSQQRNNLEKEIFNKLYGEVNTKNDVLTFNTINSNDVNDYDYKVPVNYKSSSNISAREYSYSYDYHVKSVHKPTKDTFEYGDNYDNLKQYFIPFGFLKDHFFVKISGSSPIDDGNQFKNACRINVGTVGYPENYVNYRSIDINNPFPRAGNNKNNIPSNWRGYDSNRLANSYNYLHYSVGSTNALKNIFNYDYATFDSISKNGTSSFIRDNDGTIVANVNNYNYCKRGQWSAACDRN